METLCSSSTFTLNIKYRSFLERNSGIKMPAPSLSSSSSAPLSFVSRIFCAVCQSVFPNTKTHFSVPLFPVNLLYLNHFSRSQAASVLLLPELSSLHCFYLHFRTRVLFFLHRNFKILSTLLRYLKFFSHLPCYCCIAVADKIFSFYFQFRHLYNRFISIAPVKRAFSSSVKSPSFSPAYG